MEFYELCYIVEDDAQKRLSELAKRYEKINGWNEKDLLQFAVAATSKGDIEVKLRFLEDCINEIELEQYSQGVQVKNGGNPAEVRE